MLAAAPPIPHQRMKQIAERTPTGAAKAFARRSNCGFCDARKAIEEPIATAFAAGARASRHEDRS